MEKTLKLYSFVDGTPQNDVPFPPNDNQAELLDFTYTATRMGNAPTITGTLNWKSCLDSLWDEKVYVQFNGEKYYLKGTPSSSYSNESVMYKHELTFVSERVALERIYFLDVVSSTSGDVGYVSNSAKVAFFGNITEFVKRLNKVLQKSGTGYSATVDNSVTSAKFPKAFVESMISFEDKYVLDAINEDCYNAFEVPYYFNGKVITFAENSSDVGTFSYGITNSLLSIQKNNANSDIVTRCSGRGSSENLPYYYPNESSTGKHSYTTNFANASLSVRRINYDTLAKKIDLFNIGDGQQGHLPSKVLTYCTSEDYSSLNKHINIAGSIGYTFTGQGPQTPTTVSVDGYNNVEISDKKDIHGFGLEVFVKLNSTNSGYVQFDVKLPPKTYVRLIHVFSTKLVHSLFGEIKGSTYAIEESLVSVERQNTEGGAYQNVDFTKLTDYEYGFNTGEIAVNYRIKYSYYRQFSVSQTSGPNDNVTVSGSFSLTTVYDYAYSNKPYFSSVGDSKRVSLGDSGIIFNDPSLLTNGDTITITREGIWIDPQGNLMPPIYRGNEGKEQFYDAVNYPFNKPQGYTPGLPRTYQYNGVSRGEYVEDDKVKNLSFINQDVTPQSNYEFDNLYASGKQKEHIENFDDIKPSITGMLNASNHRIDQVADVYFETSDSDAYTVEGSTKTYAHPYFFVKLRPFNGATGGFNLFDHAMDSTNMQLSFTSGKCGGCVFDIMVDEDTKKNTVQVDSNGDLVKDSYGNVVFGKAQESQNDTSTGSVWIALKKDTSTYGVIMPNITKNMKIAANDIFVILGISLPFSYISDAEIRLEKAIIKYMYEHNIERYKFSIQFSRIYLEQNPSVLSSLKESAKLGIYYPVGSSDPITLYVSTYTYKMDHSSPLPEITVDVSDEIMIPKSSISKITNEVSRTVVSEISGTTSTSQANLANARRSSSSVDMSGYVRKGEEKSITSIMLEDESVNSKTILGRSVQRVHLSDELSKMVYSEISLSEIISLHRSSGLSTDHEIQYNAKLIVDDQGNRCGLINYTDGGYGHMVIEGQFSLEEYTDDNDSTYYEPVFDDTVGYTFLYSTRVRSVPPRGEAVYYWSEWAPYPEAIPDSTINNLINTICI